MPTDEETLRQLGAKLASTRLAHNQTQSSLAEAAGVSRATIQRLEAGQSTQLTNLIRVLRALRLPSLLELVPAPEVRPLEVLERGRRKRRRASAPEPNGAKDDHEPWTWGPEA
jgi:transcriptional regulator with XRE-family HTH domain